MDAEGFSFPSEQHRREIKSLCTEIFNGRRTVEVFKDYKRWIPYIVDIYLPICDEENGGFRSLPFPGSLMDQPYMTMQILLCIQGEYRAHKAAKMEQMRLKQPSSRSTPRARKRR